MHNSDPLREISGVGPSISADLNVLRVRKLTDLEDADPQALYERLCVKEGGTVDRWVLYVFRSAVDYATTERHDRELLKWWNWKDRPELDGRRSGNIPRKQEQK